MRILPPSRGRNVAALAATGVAGKQPICRALPSLIVGSPGSKAEHVRAACAASPVASLINLALPMRVRNLLSPHISDPAGTVARRSRAMDTFRDIAAKLAPYAQRWAGRLPAGSPATLINLPLLHLLVHRFDYPDKDIVRDLVDGMPIAGPIPERPTLLPRVKDATMPVSERLGGIGARNKCAIDRVERFRATELGAE